MREISAEAVRAGFAEVISRAAYGHERTIVTRNGKAVAAIVPLADLEQLTGDGGSDAGSPAGDSLRVRRDG
ncbi:MAG: hypothetical protein AUH82_02500 [Chloroflexi bacterium 13_1_40CM_4_65_13]|nr:MAG: hypothetical protein AUH82_02500 [Chloroflexi bacterium 13_1_40CM_4_65_13]